MKKTTFLPVGTMLFFLFALPAFSQMAWKYTRINGTGGLSKSSLPAPSSLLTQNTLSDYANIALHSNANVDQSEMSIGTAPTNTFNVLAGANAVDQSVSPVHYNQGCYYSTTEGGSWAGNDKLPATYPDTLSDPAVAYDLNGNAFFGFMEYRYITGWRVAVKKSTNNGTTWGGDVFIPNLGDPDKDHMTVDVNSSSSYKNFVYVACTDFSLYPSPIKLSRSTDGGSNFSAAVAISGSSGYNFAHGVCLAVGPDGTLYATWVYYDQWPGFESSIGFNKSTDGGQSWGTPMRITPNGFSGIRSWDYPYYLHKGTNIRAASFPSMDVDRSSGPNSGKIYIVWANATNTTNHTIPYIELISSANGGSTWSSMVQVNNDNSSTDKWEPWVSVDTYGGVNVVFYDSRIDPTNNVSTQAYMARSTDGGSSFPNYQISSVAFTPSMIPNTAYGYMGDYLGITSTRQYAVPCWNDNRTGHQQAYAAQFDILLDLATQNKSVSSQATAFNGQRKFYRESSGKLHEVFASGTITAGEIFYRNSTDNGATWNVTKRLSDGTATSLAPCITVGPGPTVIVVWQQTNGSNYNVVFSRSISGGTSWSSITSLQSNFSCGSPGPLPSVSANVNTGSVGIVYRASSGLRFVYSTSNMGSWSGPSSIPNTNGNYNAPSTAFYPVASPMADKCNLAFGTYPSSYSSRLYYGYFGFQEYTWSSLSDLSSVLPSSYAQHQNPSLAVSSNSTTTVHVAWESTLMGPPTPVLVHRKGSSGNFGSQYTVIQYQSPNKPSISGVTSDNAWMVFGSSSASNFYKVKYYNNGSSWIWGNPSYVSSGNYAQLSVGSSGAKYLWTAGTSSPYTINIGSETLSKTAPLAFDYSRELNFIDTASGSSISLEVRQPKIVHKDGTVSLVSFVDAPPDSVVISPKEILDYGNTQSFVASTDIDTLRLRYSVRTIRPGNLLQNANGSLSFGIFDESTGKLLGTIANRAVAEVADSVNNMYQINLPANVVRSLANGKYISIRPTVIGLLPSQMIASLGHVYKLDAEEASEFQKGTLAEATIPKEYILQQNYPNPFNPTTQISYSIPKDGMVTLKVYDALGREVETLVNEAQTVGRYEVTFDGSRLSSGVYFYRLVAGSHVFTRKLMLVK